MDIRVKITRDGSNAIKTMDIEEYLRGVVPSEMSSTWPPEALKAQAVAARTYAMGKINASKDFDVDDTVKYQAYHEGRTRETTDAAILATEGQAVRYGSKLAQTVFSASNGGRTVSALKKWGNDIPYLIDQDDPWDAASGEKKNGHGVGMSQHGARQAALQGVSYKEILLWYYPGCWIDGIQTDTVVKYVGTKASPLNIRDKADGDIIAKASKGTPVLARELEDGWRHVGLFVEGKMVEGWAKEDYLSDAD